MRLCLQSLLAASVRAPVELRARAAPLRATAGAALALSACLPSSGDLGEYSERWGEQPAPVQPAAGSSSALAGASGGAAASGGSTSTAPPSDPAAAEQCSDGVLDDAQASCYFLAALPATWQVARGACVSWGGELVKVETSTEDQLIAGLVPQDLWLGASDTAAENVFVWNDGSPIVFGNWGPAQPDRFPGPDCIQKRSAEGGAWFDQPCDNSWLYICEKAIVR